MRKRDIQNRIIDITSNDELEQFEKLLQDEFMKHEGMDTSCEDWLDSEFNRVFVAYMYPDVTRVN